MNSYYCNYNIKKTKSIKSTGITTYFAQSLQLPQTWVGLAISDSYVMTNSDIYTTFIKQNGQVIVQDRLVSLSIFFDNKQNIDLNLKCNYLLFFLKRKAIPWKFC